MSTGSQKRTRSQRVAALELPPGLIERTLEALRQVDVLLRIGLCALAALVLWAMMSGGEPPFPFRRGYVPPRNIDARVSFEVYDEGKTREAQQKARSQVKHVYDQDPEPIRNLRGALLTKLATVKDAATLADLDPQVWQEFQTPEALKSPPPPDQQEAEFQEFRKALAGDDKLQAVSEAVGLAFLPIERHGLLKDLQRDDREGNTREITIHPREGASEGPVDSGVAVADVQIPTASVRLRERLEAELLARPETRPGSTELASRIHAWVHPKLPETLKHNPDLSEAAADAAAKAVPNEAIAYEQGDMLAPQDQPLIDGTLKLLHIEHDHYKAQLTFTEKLARTWATLGMFLAMYTLCGFYIFYRERRLLKDIRQFSIVLAMVVATVGLCIVAARDEWRAEVIPLLLFGMTIAIAYHQELALLLTAALTLIVVIALGQGLAAFVTMMSAVAAAVLLLGRIRSRRKLIYVGLCSGLVATLTSLGVHLLDAQPLGPGLFWEAVRVGAWGVVAGFLMTGLLPFIENLFGVLTDISLLELGDVAHPLLQELVRRAPGTYNHSINVASIAEAAAESIGARGLLVRVGAYFHDIGKMLKPGYFAENQGLEGSRHESLVPAMSTLIIIAHIKDGADLARQHHVPQPIIDFIQQHHGTTLVEYFFRRASEQSQGNPDAASVDESSFRYPGPKPQTKEAGVLMLADAVESASRVLTDPTPARIESLVQEIAMKRLLDGQFDECGLTLSEVNTIQESLVKSLTAVYHGRVKYPGQRTA